VKIEMIDIDRVIPYARNPRKNAGAVDKVAASLREFGFRQPIVTDENLTVIVGHTRLLAAKKLSLPQVPVHVAEGLTDAQIKAYRIADNRVGEEAEWDNELLQVELHDIESKEFDVALTGFDGDELSRIMFPPDFSPGTEDDQGKLDELDPKWVCCPNCQTKFDARKA
jgi:ParB-like chromosome segregation protein Spo0J